MLYDIHSIIFYDTFKYPILIRNAAIISESIFINYNIKM